MGTRNIKESSGANVRANHVKLYLTDHFNNNKKDAGSGLGADHTLYHRVRPPSHNRFLERLGIKHRPSGTLLPQRQMFYL